MTVSKSASKKKKKSNKNNSINLKVEELELQLEKNNQKYLRLLAEFDNYKKRVNSDIKEQRKYSGSDIIGSFLAVFDDIHRILEHKDVSDLSKIIEGIELIDNNINNILDNYGITSFDSIGKTFDHNFHEAIVQKSSKEKEGVIIEEFQRGYLYHDKVIRHAKVIVSSGKEE